MLQTVPATGGSVPDPKPRQIQPGRRSFSKFVLHAGLLRQQLMKNQMETTNLHFIFLKTHLNVSVLHNFNIFNLQK